MPHAYTEDQLVGQPAIGLFAELGWTTVLASEETFGATGTLLRETKGEVVLVARLRAALERLNPALPPEAITATHCSYNFRRQAFPFIPFLGVQLLLGVSSLSRATSEPWAAELSAVFDQLVRDQRVVGAQIVVGQNELVRLEHYSGRRFPGQPEAVDANTLFCIGSDSKPMATAIIMTLVADGRLQLEAPISKWLPAFGSLRTEAGAPAGRSPTLRELMCHRSGIFSQQKEPRREQLALIYNFSRTLDEAVRDIAHEPLLTQPGQAYAYSGAGYCVLGRVAELASGRSMEDLLQMRLCRPLQLQDTTYFPENPSKVAVGSRRVAGRSVPDSQAPHLALPRHRFTLVGGSIYSTAIDQARFAQMVLAHGRSGGKQILPPAVWSEWIGRQSPNPNYGLGWFQTFGNKGNEPSRLSHEGALACYRACLVVNLQTGFFCTANWTLAGLESEAGVGAAVRQAVQKAEKIFVKPATARP